jgi:hypothetical protein
MILYHSADLLWATRIKGTAEAIGLAARPVRSTDMLDARLGDSPVKALIVDLDAPEIAMELINRLRGPNASPTEKLIRIVAFGPHVAVEAFASARNAGANQVLARGAFSRHLPEWLTALSSDPGSAGSSTAALPTTE